MATTLEYQTLNSRISYPFLEGREVIASPQLWPADLVDFQFVDLVGTVKRLFISRIVSVANTSITFYFTNPDNSTLTATLVVAAADAVDCIGNTSHSFVSSSSANYSLKMEFGPGVTGLISTSFDTTYTVVETEFSPTVITPYSPTVKSLVVNNNYPIVTAHTFEAGTTVNLIPGANIDAVLAAGLSLGVIPRAGKGLYTSCPELDSTKLATLNGRVPDSNGNIALQFDDSYSVTLLSEADLTLYADVLTAYTPFSIPYQSPNTFAALSVGHSFLVQNNYQAKCAPVNMNAFADYMARVQDGMFELYGAAVESDHTSGDFTATSAATTIAATLFTSTLSGQSGFIKYFHEGKTITIQYSGSTQVTTIVEVLDDSDIIVADALIGSGSATFLIADEGIYNTLNDTIVAYNTSVEGLVIPYSIIRYNTMEGTNELGEYGTFVPISIGIANPTGDTITYEVDLALSGTVEIIPNTTKIRYGDGVILNSLSGTLNCKETAVVEIILFVPCGMISGTIGVTVNRDWPGAISPSLINDVTVGGRQTIAVESTDCDSTDNDTVTLVALSGTPFIYNIPGYTTALVVYDTTTLPSWMTVDTAIPPATYNLSGTPTESTSTNYLITSNILTSTATTQFNMLVKVVAVPVITPETVSGGVGVFFFYQVSATNSPTSWSATSLPAGVTIDTATGVLSGVPTTVTNYSTAVTATNAAGSDTETITIDIVASLIAPSITSSLTTIATQGDSFTYTITASQHPTRYGVSGLPTGLTLNSSTGVISGVPTTHGVTDILISASNGAGTDTETLVLTTSLIAPVITSPNTAAVAEGAFFSYTITAAHSPSSFSASGLPTNLNVDTFTGVISGIASESGVFSVTLGATNTAGTGPETLTLTVGSSSPVITSSLSVSFSQGGSVGYNITATNDPTSFSTGTLPVGLVLDAATGHISGSVSTIGVYSFDITATNAFGYDTQLLSLSISATVAPVITSASTVTFNQGLSSSYQIIASNYPTSYSSGTLPTGLYLDTSSGQIYGIPSGFGSSSVLLTATNAIGAGTMTLTITVNQEPPVIVSSPVATGTNGQSLSFQLVASNTPTGYGSTGLPSWASLDTSTGIITGIAASGTTSCTVTATNGAGTGTQALSFMIP
jgi:hypothetical protein